MLSQYIILHCCTIVALAEMATQTDYGLHIVSETSRRLGGGGGGSRRRAPVPAPPPEPTFFVYHATVTPAECVGAIDAQDSYLEVGNSDKETNWNEGTFGHAHYSCLEPMIRGSQQYAKAISYAWCVYPHCKEKCPGADCPAQGTVAKCQSAVKNWLGYAARKRVNANLSEAQQYYDEAISSWPENCGALGYRAELELQMGNILEAKSKLSALCTDSACSDHDAVREAATTFWKHANTGRQNVPAECDWALALNTQMSMAIAHHVALSIVFACATATMQLVM